LQLKSFEKAGISSIGRMPGSSIMRQL